MSTEQELSKVIDVDRHNIELETKIENIRDEIEQNHKRIVECFFPFLLSAYDKWRPGIGEKAMAINFVSHICFEVIIKHIDGNMVRAQEGENSNVYHRFNLNTILENHRFPDFIIPKSSYDEIKDFFDFRFLH